MTQRWPYLFIMAALFAGGIATAVFRHDTYRIPYLPGTAQSVWQIEAKVEFEASGDPVQVALTLPPVQAGFTFLEGTAASPGYGSHREQGRAQQLIRWSKRDARGIQTLFYKFEAVEAPDFAPPPADETAPTAESLVWDEPYDTAVASLLASAVPRSADGYTLARELLVLMNTTPVDQNVALLLSEWDPPRLLPRLLRQAGVAARTVTALDLQDRRRRQELRELVQVWDGSGWRLLDPQTDGAERPDNLLLWQTSEPSVLEVIGGTNSRVLFSMINQTRSALSLVSAQSANPLLSLYSLPIEEQSLFKLIMLLPVGALVVVLMRILVGIRTSGTFMPVLIALAFLQTQLVTGLISFLLVVATGLVLRSYLSALNLLLVARIATLVIVVIGIISVVSIVSYRLGLIGGLTITFFPMIILAWTIERMSILWEEEGPKEVLIQGGGSLFVATIAFLLMQQPVVQHLAFNFPELHLCLLALILLVGRYTGYRLTELVRFSGMRGAD
ncbi:MAG: inactive transglutaminase family protein [Pseudomonadota bacterium]